MQDEAEFEAENELIHVIYEDGEFRKTLHESFDQWGITKLGFDYLMCGVLGPQSSGKSTLLNLLFGSKFPMLEEGARHQCTKGIWMGKSASTKAASGLLLLDVEGTDGRERGDDEVAFERKTSLFSLVLSEILLVNMWASDVGRNNAANLPLLKTVFDLNLQLFATEKRSRTMLLFVLRDHVPQQTDKNTLVDLIRKDMAKIWAELPSAEGKKIDDYFVFDFVALPHKVLAADQFNAAVKKLSSRFNDPSDGEYLWRPEFKSAIPMDGLAHFAGQIWETIRENKDLDLPSQREMLAMFRCEEISNTAYESFQSQLDPVKKEIVSQQKVLDDFGARVSAIIDDALKLFDEPASNYHEEVVSRKRATLLTSILKDVKDVWNTHVALEREVTVIAFGDALRKSLDPKEAAEEQSLDFGLVVDQLKQQHSDDWQQRVDASIPSDAQWDYDLPLEELRKQMDDLVAQEREKQLRLVLSQVKKELQALGLKLDDILSDATPNMWSEIRAAVADGCGEVNDDLKLRLKTFSLGEEELRKALADVAKTQREYVRKKVTAQVHTLDYRMEKRFDEHFKVDPESGLPREWKPGGDQVKPIYSDAVQQALQLLHLFTVMRVDDDADDSLGIKIDGLKLEGDEDEMKAPEPEKVLINRPDAGKILEKFNKHARSAAAEANRAIANFGKSEGISTMMIILLCVLGFNEAIWVLSNPLFMVMLVIFGGVGYVLHMTGMLRVVMPVVNQVMRGVVANLSGAISGANGNTNVDTEKKNQ